MKKIILTIIIIILYSQVNGQLKIETGANLVVAGNPTIVLQDMNFVNNGHWGPDVGTVKFVGFQNSSISSSNQLGFYMMDIAKTNSAKVSLNNNLGINVSINFISGQLDLNGNNISLSASGYLTGENRTQSYNQHQRRIYSNLPKYWHTQYD
jgi:hypothetical protein